MESKLNNEQVNIVLNKEEALVFLEWLSRTNELEVHNIKDQAEERVLYDLEAVLERVISETCKDTYQQNLQQAREKIRD